MSDCKFNEILDDNKADETLNWKNIYLWIFVASYQNKILQIIKGSKVVERWSIFCISSINTTVTVAVSKKNITE